MLAFPLVLFHHLVLGTLFSWVEYIQILTLSLRETDAGWG